MCYDKSIIHAFAVGRTLAAAPCGLTAAKLADSVGMTYAALRVLLAALVKRGVVVRSIGQTSAVGGRPFFLYFTPENAPEEDDAKTSPKSSKTGDDDDKDVDENLKNRKDDEDDDDDENGENADFLSVPPVEKRAAKSSKTDGDENFKNPPSSSININTQENKSNKRARVWRAFGKKNKKNTNTAEVVDEGASIRAALASVNVDDAEGQALRRTLRAVVWEPSLRAELLDRAVAAVKLGLCSSASLISCAKRAASIASKEGIRIWETFALDVKRAFDSALYVWTPTAPGAEPAPKAFELRLNDSVKRDDSKESDLYDSVYSDASGRNFVSLRFA